jgi:hypothetical protein
LRRAIAIEIEMAFLIQIKKAPFSYSNSLVKLSKLKDEGIIRLVLNWPYLSRAAVAMKNTGKIANKAKNPQIMCRHKI